MPTLDQHSGLESPCRSNDRIRVGRISGMPYQGRRASNIIVTHVLMSRRYCRIGLLIGGKLPRFQNPRHPQLRILAMPCLARLCGGQPNRFCLLILVALRVSRLRAYGGGETLSNRRYGQSGFRDFFPSREQATYWCPAHNSDSPSQLRKGA